MISREKLKKECSIFYKMGYKLGYRDGLIDKDRLTDEEISEIVSEKIDAYRIEDI